MAKALYRHKEFRKDSLKLIAFANSVIFRYLDQNLKLTLRQLYYQFVAANVLPNTEKSYKNLGSLISDARLAGLVDWNAIQDRVRQPEIPSEWENLGALTKSALAAYRLPRWEGQDKYVELWVEKDALAGVLQPLADEYHVTLMVNRGYSSQSAMYDSAQRFRRNRGRTGILLYLGDHDPSGEDMVRDVSDRLAMFHADVDVTKVALTMDQIEEYDPPPNPAKMSDSRAEAYVLKHGDSSWELDSLRPEVLQEIVRDALEKHVDHALMDEVIKREALDREALTKAVSKIEGT